MIKKILIIDDSALMRRVLSDIIKSDMRFAVGNVASNGLEGFDFITRDEAKYDAVILDINMPKMNGLEFLHALDRHHIHTKVIVVSTIAKEGTKETIEALELGAFDFVTKPDNFYEVKSNQFKEKVLNCLSAALKLGDGGSYSEIAATSYKPNSSYHKKDSICTEAVRRPENVKKIIALACSTGGPKALQSVIPSLPKEIDASLLIVQHMPVGFTKSLAQRLNEMSQIMVKEAEDGEELKKGYAYIAVGGKHLKVVRGLDGSNCIRITDEPARMGLRPCADMLYESLVSSDYDLVTCVVLTGMGADGTNGIKLLKEKKEVYVIAQDEETSTVYGMPKMVVANGLVNEILPLTQIADAITKNVGVK